MTTVSMPGRTFTLRYSIGDVVYLRTADERCRGLITGITVNPAGFVYWVSWPDCSETKHYELELTAEYVPDFAQGEHDDA